MDVPEEKARVIRAVVQEIEKVPDAVARGEYLKQAERTPGGRRGDAPERSSRPGARTKAPEAGISFSPAEKRLLQILFENKEIAPTSSRRSGRGISGACKSEPVFSFIQELLPERPANGAFSDLKETVDAPVLDSLSRALQERTRRRPPSKEARDCLQGAPEGRLPEPAEGAAGRDRPVGEKGRKGEAAGPALPETGHHQADPGIVKGI